MLPSDVQAKKLELTQHVRMMRQERKVAMDLHREAAGRDGWMFEYDDKCGSHFLHLPLTSNSRDGDGRWKYHMGLQGNMFIGLLMRMSIVPPCLKTGTNFALTSLLSALWRLLTLGKLGHTFVRQARPRTATRMQAHHSHSFSNPHVPYATQTDSGTDNDSKETHFFHWILIHFGVLDKIIWIRLKPHHSHNLSDRVNSMVKEVMQPKRGAGGGCKAPWCMEDIVKKALETQPGM